MFVFVTMRFFILFFKKLGIFELSFKGKYEFRKKFGYDKKRVIYFLVQEKRLVQVWRVEEFGQFKEQ